MTRRVLMITGGYSLLDGPFDPERSVRSTPPDTFAHGFGALLDRVARVMDGSGVLLLDGSAATTLRLPVGPTECPSVGHDEAKAAGWLMGSPGALTTFYGDGKPTITLAVTAWPDFAELVGPLAYQTTHRHTVDQLSPLDTVARLSLWHELSGVSWSGSAGVVGLKLFRAHCPEFSTGNKGKIKPSFKFAGSPEGAYEIDYLPKHFRRDPAAGENWEHGYDATRMYLAAAGVCETLSPWSLKPTGKRTFDPRAAGWWLVKLGPWNDDRLPPPAGPAKRPSEVLTGEETRWVTTPTLTLLSDLQRAGGASQDFEVVDSMTAPGKRILRGWAEHLETVYQAARAMSEADDLLGSSYDARAVMSTVKRCYREAWGMLNNASSSVHRPDWHYTILAQARANLFRKMMAVGLAENRWPNEVNVDEIFYGSRLAEPYSAAPNGIPVTNAIGQTDRLGTFKAKSSRTKGKAAE